MKLERQLEDFGWITTAQAAKILRVSRPTVRMWHSQGALGECLVTPNQRFYSKPHIQRYRLVMDGPPLPPEGLTPWFTGDTPTKPTW